MINETRSGQMVSAQIGRMGVINTAADFSLPAGQVFNIKNEGDDAVVLEVQLAGMAAGQFVETVFEVGWNPEIVKTLKASGATDLKWGC